MTMTVKNKAVKECGGLLPLFTNCLEEVFSETQEGKSTKRSRGARGDTTSVGTTTNHLAAVRSAASILCSSSSIPQGQSTFLCEGRSPCAASSARLSSESEISSMTINPLSLVISLSDDKRESCSSVLNNAHVGVSTKSWTSSSAPGSVKDGMGMNSARHPESRSSSARIRLPSGSSL